MGKEELLNIVHCCSSVEVNNIKFMTAVAWIQCLLRGETPFEWLYQRGIEEIIIYGVTELGELLVQEAAKEGFKVFGITDRRVVNGEYEFHGIPIIRRNEISKYSEKYIVVASVAFWEEIKKELNELGCRRVIALWELVDHEVDCIRL